jgi:hypothetical protein
MVPIGLVFSIHDTTEVAIQKMIDASQKMITMARQGTLAEMMLEQKRKKKKERGEKIVFSYVLFCLMGLRQRTSLL